MIQHLRWLFLLELQIYAFRLVTLNRTNQLAVLGYREALLVATCNDRFNQFVIQFTTVTRSAPDQRVYIRPAFRIQRQTNRLRFVSQYEAEKFACLVPQLFLVMAESQRRSATTPIRTSTTSNTGARL